MTDPDVARVKEVFRAVGHVRCRGAARLHAACGAGRGARSSGRRRLGGRCGSSTWVAATRGWQPAASAEQTSSITWASIWRSRPSSGARGNLAIWPGTDELVCGNLADVLAGLPDGSANTVLASYSLHHFSTVDKLKLVDEVWRLLEPGGAFLWIDAVRDDGEIARRLHRPPHARHGRTIGSGSASNSASVVSTHVRTSDFPETKSWMLAHVEAAGFRPGGTLLQDEFFDGWAFFKP